MTQEGRRRGSLGALFRRWFKPAPRDDAMPGPGANGSASGADGRPADDAPEVLIRRIREFSSLQADDVMIPRADIVAIPITMTVGEALMVFAEHQHSRLPVYDRELDRVRGVLHLKDLLKDLAESPGGAFDIKRTVASLQPRSAFIVTNFAHADMMLREMRRRRQHLAVVVDEHGAVTGLVSLEDLVEQIVGDIDDEFDSEADQPVLLEVRPGQVWDADGKLALEDLGERLGVDLSLSDEEDTEASDTLAGLVAQIAGRLPRKGEAFTHPRAALRFEIVDANSRKINRVRVRRTQADGGSAEGEGA